MQEDSLLPTSSLSEYGEPVACFDGEGGLTLATGRRVPVRFVAGQLRDGETLLLCATTEPPLSLWFRLVQPQQFQGVTSKKLKLIATGLTETDYLPEVPQKSGAWIAMRVRELEVSPRLTRRRERLTFSVANVRGLSFPLSFPYGRSEFKLSPLPDAKASLARLQVSRGVLPTAALRIQSRGDLAGIRAAADDLCYLISLALGTKVQWLSLVEETKAGSAVRWYYSSRVTKRYGVLAIIDPRGRALEDFLKQAAQRDFTSRRRSLGLSDAVIDSYLDAKAEGDFLQVRALKLVAAVEMLRAELHDQGGEKASVLSPDVFSKLESALRTTIKAELSGPEMATQRGVLYGHLSRLNRVPFADELAGICDRVGFDVSESEVRQFVMSRNKLVHEGRFYCERATEAERKRVRPFKTLIEEWFSLLHFVDRLFLRCAGYNGRYIDWSKPGKPDEAEL